MSTAPETEADTDIWYRFAECRVSNGVDEYENGLGHHMEVRCNTYRVVRRTPKGAWIVQVWGKNTSGRKRFVLTASHKHYACPTVDEAKASFRARKKKQISIYSARIADAKKALLLIDGKGAGTCL